MRKQLLLLAFIACPLFAMEEGAEKCSIVEKQSGEVVNVNGLSVLSGEDLPTQLKNAGVDRESIVALMCIRKSVIPVPNDKQVLMIGFPFYIGSKEGGQDKMIALEFTKQSGYRIRLLSGQLTDLEKQQAASVLKIFAGNRE
jgi:hypothetical protein